MDAQHPAAPAALRLTGRVEGGVEHGSVVLRAATGATWQLGPRWGHLAGQEVVVTGTPQHGLLTTAQQGTPLAVAQVSALDGTRLQPRDLPTAGDPRAL